MFAFCCKKCGHFETSEQAGESKHPHACPVCGSGVTLDKGLVDMANEMAQPECTPARRLAIIAELVKPGRTIEKVLHSDNWEVLDECSPERLKELGIEKEQVMKHVPLPQSGNVPKNVTAHASEGVATDETAIKK